MIMNKKFFVKGKTKKTYLFLTLVSFLLFSISSILTYFNRTDSSSLVNTNIFTFILSLSFFIQYLMCKRWIIIFSGDTLALRFPLTFKRINIPLHSAKFVRLITGDIKIKSEHEYEISKDYLDAEDYEKLLQLLDL